MIKWIKSNFWFVLGSLVVLAVIVLFRDMDRAEELKSFFRRKRVEDEVGELKRRIADSDSDLQENEEKLVELAEELKKNKKKVEEATDEEIIGFYDELLNGK